MTEKRIIRVFPRKTHATPDDENVVIGRGPHPWEEADEVCVSVTFTYDNAKVEQLARDWEKVAPTKLGGPATGMAGGDFVPGRYVKEGYVITSRGCLNNCWFCSVWRREGREIRELPIRDGWNILDDNLLACSDGHIRAVFAMLAKQGRPVEFTGGLESARLKDWHVDLLASLRPHQMFFAYDTPDDLEPLMEAGRKFRWAGMAYTKSGSVSHCLRAYVLIGYPKDTFDAADKRLRECYAAGFLPMSMLYRGEDGKTSYEWRRFQKAWARAASVNRMCRDGTKPDFSPKTKDCAGQMMFSEEVC